MAAVCLALSWGFRLGPSFGMYFSAASFYLILCFYFYILGVHGRAQSFNHVCLFATLGNVAGQASLSMGFSRQEYCSGLPFPSPEDLPNPGIKLTSLASLALAGRFFTTEPPGKLQLVVFNNCTVLHCINVTGFTQKWHTFLKARMHVQSLSHL